GRTPRVLGGEAQAASLVVVCIAALVIVVLPFGGLHGVLDAVLALPQKEVEVALEPLVIGRRTPALEQRGPSDRAKGALPEFAIGKSTQVVAGAVPARRAQRVNAGMAGGNRLVIELDQCFR